MQTSEKTQTQREKLPDILKGFAVILVVLGHCIQEGSGETFSVRSLYFYDKLYQFIYSFHMPLFIAVSGYLCWGSIQNAHTWPEWIALLRRRSIRLLAPVLLWTASDTIRSLIVTGPDQSAPFQPAAFLLSFFWNTLNNLWFLWAVFWCFLIVSVMHFFFHNSVILYLVGFGIMFFIPDGMNLGAYKYVLPFFITAFYLHGYMERHECRLIREPTLWQILLTGLVFAILFAFFDENSMIYLSGYKLIGKDVLRQLGIDFYRALIGFAGTLFFTLLWQYILRKRKNCKFRILTALGENSMGIYILSGYLLLLFVRRLAFLEEPSYLVNVVETLILLPLSLFLTVLAEKMPFFCLFVGKERVKSATLL